MAGFAGIRTLTIVVASDNVLTTGYITITIEVVLKIGPDVITTARRQKRHSSIGYQTPLSFEKERRNVA